MEASSDILTKLTSLKLCGINSKIVDFFEPLHNGTIHLGVPEARFYRQRCAKFLDLIHKQLKLPPGVTDDEQKEELVEMAITCGSAAIYTVEQCQEPDQRRVIPYLLCQIINKIKIKEHVGSALQLAESVLTLLDPIVEDQAPGDSSPIPSTPTILTALGQILWTLSNSLQPRETLGDPNNWSLLLRLWKCSLKCRHLASSNVSASKQMEQIAQLLANTIKVLDNDPVLDAYVKVAEAFNDVIGCDTFQLLPGNIQQENRYAFVTQDKMVALKQLLMQAFSNKLEDYIKEGSWLKATHIVAATMRLKDASVGETLALWGRLKSRALINKQDNFTSMTFLSVMRSVDFCDMVPLTDKQLLMQEYLVWRKQPRREFTVEFHLLCEISELSPTAEEMGIIQLELSTLMSITGFKYKERDAIEVLTDAMGSQPSCPGVSALLLYHKYALLHEQTIQSVRPTVENISVNCMDDLIHGIQYTLQSDQSNLPYLIEAVQMWEKYFIGTSPRPSCTQDTTATNVDGTASQPSCTQDTMATNVGDEFDTVSIVSIVDTKRHVDELLFCGARLVAMKLPVLAGRALKLALAQLPYLSDVREAADVRCTLVKSLILLENYQEAESLLSEGGANSEEEELLRTELCIATGQVCYQEAEPLLEGGANSEEEELLRTELCIATKQIAEGLAVVNSTLAQLNATSRSKSTYFRIGVAKRLLSTIMCFHGENDRVTCRPTDDNVGDCHVVNSTNPSAGNDHVMCPSSWSLFKSAKESVHFHISLLKSLHESTSASVRKWMYVRDILESVLHLSRVFRFVGIPQEGLRYMYEGLRISQIEGLPRWSCEFLHEILQVAALANQCDKAISAAHAIHIVLGRKDQALLPNKQSSTSGVVEEMGNENPLPVKDNTDTAASTAELDCFGFEELVITSSAPVQQSSGDSSAKSSPTVASSTLVKAATSEHFTAEKSAKATATVDVTSDRYAATENVGNCSIDLKMSELGVLECPCLLQGDKSCEDVIVHRLCLQYALAISEFLLNAGQSDLAAKVMEDIETKFASSVLNSGSSQNSVGHNGIVTDVQLRGFWLEFACLQAEIGLRRKDYQKVRDILTGSVDMGSFLEHATKVWLGNALCARLALCEMALHAAQVDDIADMLKLKLTGKTVSTNEEKAIIVDDLLQLKLTDKKVSTKKEKDSNIVNGAMGDAENEIETIAVKSDDDDDIVFPSKKPITPATVQRRTRRNKSEKGMSARKHLGVGRKTNTVKVETDHEQKPSKSSTNPDNMLFSTPSNKALHRLTQSSKKQQMSQVLATPLSCRKVAIDFLMESDDEDDNIVFPPKKLITPAAVKSRIKRNTSRSEPRKLKCAGLNESRVNMPVCNLTSILETSPDKRNNLGEVNVLNTDDVCTAKDNIKDTLGRRRLTSVGRAPQKIVSRNSGSRCKDTEYVQVCEDVVEYSEVTGRTSEGIDICSTTMQKSTTRGRARKGIVSRNSGSRCKDTEYVQVCEDVVEDSEVTGPTSEDIDICSTTKQKNTTRGRARKGTALRTRKGDKKENEIPTKLESLSDNSDENHVRSNDLCAGEGVNNGPNRKIVEESGHEISGDTATIPMESNENPKRLLKFGGCLSKENKGNIELVALDDAYDFIPSPNVGVKKGKAKRKVLTKGKNKTATVSEIVMTGSSKAKSARETRVSTESESVITVSNKAKSTRGTRVSRNRVKNETTSCSRNVNGVELDEIEMTRNVRPDQDKKLMVKDLLDDYDDWSLAPIEDSSMWDIPQLLEEDDLDDFIAELSDIELEESMEHSPLKLPQLEEHDLDLIGDFSDFDLEASLEISLEARDINTSDRDRYEIGLPLQSSPIDSVADRNNDDDDGFDPIEAFRGPKNARKTKSTRNQENDEPELIRRDAKNGKKSKTRRKIEEVGVNISEEALPGADDQCVPALDGHVIFSESVNNTVSRLETHYGQLRTLAPYPVFPQVCKTLAAHYLRVNPTRAALYLSNAMYITFRHMVLLNEIRRFRTLRDGKKSGAMDCAEPLDVMSDVTSGRTMSAVTDGLMFHKDEQHLQAIIDIIPADWSVVQLSHVTVGVSAPRRILTRFVRGEAPVVVQLPDSQVPVLETFSSVMNSLNTLSQYKEKEAWWKLRERQNYEIMDTVKNMETFWLGHWAGLLRPREYARETLQKVTDELKGVVREVIPPGLIEVLLQCCGQRSDKASMLVCARDLLRSHDLGETGLQHVISVVRRHAKPVTKHTQHVVLILDKEYQQLPWERMPVLEDVSVSRMPCLAHVYTQLQQSQGDNSVLDKGVNPHKTFYILNPDQDCPNAEKKFKDWFQKQKGWDGVCNVRPTQEQFSSGITQHDLFIYIGHGAGGRYFARTEIEKLRGRAAIMLMGCSSGKLISSGQLEPDGMMISYFLAGCPCIVANLWDVTDVDIDTFTKHLLSSWLDGDHHISLSQAVQNSRQACKMKYVTGAAPVVYGLPVFKVTK